MASIKVKVKKETRPPKAKVTKTVKTVVVADEILDGGDF